MLRKSAVPNLYHEAIVFALEYHAFIHILEEKYAARIVQSHLVVFFFFAQLARKMRPAEQNRLSEMHVERRRV